MKKVIRLTESDLVRIVKRVINEESNVPAGKTDPNLGLAQKIVGTIMTATGGVGTEEQKILDSINMIKNKETYNSVINVIRTSKKVKSQYGRNFNLLIKLIETDFTSQSMEQWDITGDKKWLDMYQKILQKWNTNEIYSVSPGNWEI